MAKSYEELNFTDNFLFCKIVGSNPEIAKRLLELVLHTKIKEVHIKGSEQPIDLTPEGKSIRMDVFLDDEKHTFYDLEMQTSSLRNLPKRLRYYQGAIDLNAIEKGTDYYNLPKSVIIFICLFDFFDNDLPIYTFENICRENNSIKLGDECMKVFVNPNGNMEMLDEDTANLLKYIKNRQICDGFTQSIEDAVNRALDKKMWEAEYMRWRAYEMDMNYDKQLAVEAAAKQGREAGHKKGLEEGRKEGRKEGREEGRGIGAEEKAIEVYNKCISRGMSEAEAIDLSGITPKQLNDLKQLK